MKIKLGLSILLVAFLAACRSLAPVMDINNQTFTKGHTLEEVENAIISAASIKGWQMRIVEPGKMRGQLNMRGKHQAVVDVFYTKEDYSIKYVSSLGLKYENGKIHPNYNRWIHNLRHAITNQLYR